MMSFGEFLIFYTVFSSFRYFFAYLFSNGTLISVRNLMIFYVLYKNLASIFLAFFNLYHVFLLLRG
jgi:hypothetical protein